MSSAQHHQTLKNLLAKADWETAQALWLDLATQLSDQPEFLLLLVKEFADAGKPDLAAELAGLIVGQLKANRKHHEWLYALKLQAAAKPTDKALRAELIEAYNLAHENDPRRAVIFAAAGLDQPGTFLPAAITKTDTLFALTPGAYCQHKSWGFGRVKAFDTALNRIVIAFPHNPDHAMQLAYAADSITPVSPDHIEVRKATDLAGLKQLDPLALLRIVLLSNNRAARADQIETALVPAVIPTADWKKWWETAKKLAKKDPHFDIPAKKTDPVILRAAPVSQQDEILQSFRDARSLAQKTKIVQDFLKQRDDLANADLLAQELYDGLREAIQKTPADKRADRLEAALLLEELLPQQESPLVGTILSDVRDVATLLDQLSAPAQKRAVAALRKTNPAILLENLNRLPAKALDELTDLAEQVAPRLAQHIHNQTASLDLLYWLCRSLTNPKAADWVEAIPRHALLVAVLYAIENSDSRAATKRLRDLLFNDETLITELLAESSDEMIRDFSRQLLTTTAFEELDRRSLLARIVKEHPFVQELLVTKIAKQQPLIVSQASYERRRAELEEIVSKKIPEIAKEIGQARSYGDLRENFEYKAAKQQQRLLFRRRGELEYLLRKAQPTPFTDVSTATVQIGTTVTLTDLATGKSHTYHILGAWDGDPARHIISYPAALAQAMLNQPVGAIVEAADDAGTLRFRIERIEKTPPEILACL